MPNALHDGNNKASMIAASMADGVTIVPIKVNPSGNGIEISDGTTGTDFGNDEAVDGNRVPIFFGVSSNDGVTPITVYADASTGSILTKST